MIQVTARVYGTKVEAISILRSFCTRLCACTPASLHNIVSGHRQCGALVARMTSMSPPVRSVDARLLKTLRAWVDNSLLGFDTIYGSVPNTCPCSDVECFHFPAEAHGCSPIQAIVVRTPIAQQKGWSFLEGNEDRVL